MFAVVEVPDIVEQEVFLRAVPVLHQDGLEARVVNVTPSRTLDAEGLCLCHDNILVEEILSQFRVGLVDYLGPPWVSFVLKQDLSFPYVRLHFGLEPSCRAAHIWRIGAWDRIEGLGGGKDLSCFFGVATEGVGDGL